MAVKIVTDSCSDISQEQAHKLGISMVPAYVNFGDKAYRDGVDISVDEFYARLQQGGLHPTTATPSPGDFAAVYNQLCDETHEIVSIHVTKKHSALIESARIGRQLLGRDNCRIEVIDSAGVTVWQASGCPGGCQHSCRRRQPAAGFANGAADHRQPQRHSAA